MIGSTDLICVRVVYLCSSSSLFSLSRESRDVTGESAEAFMHGSRDYLSFSFSRTLHSAQCGPSVGSGTSADDPCGCFHIRSERKYSVGGRDGNVS